MASTIFSNQSQPGTEMPSKGIVEGIASKIMQSVNPQATFNNIVANNPSAKSALDITNKYGNGDPKAAFFNYAAEKGKNVAAERILKTLGLQ